MFRPFTKGLPLALMLGLACTACSSGSDPDPDPDPDTPGVTLTLSAGTATVAAGASTTVTATIVRSGGFTGPVTIAATGSPANVTATAGTIAAGSTTQVVTIAAGAGAAASTANLSVTGAGTGVTITPATLALTVTAVAPPADGQIGTGIEGEMAYDEFGHTVALSANGTRVIIGAPYNNGVAENSGHARVFERSGNSWVQLGADLDGEALEDRYGMGVAISDNGGRVAVGSYKNDGGGTSSGHVEIFDYNGTAWVQVGADIDGSTGRGSGWAVAMNASGSRVVIGGPGDGSQHGHVKVYELVGGTWAQVGATFAGPGELGHAVTISDDGNRVAFSYPSASGSALPGSTQVHEWNGSGWVQVGATIDGEAVGDNAGASLSFNGDGSTLAIGADYNEGIGLAGGGARSGSVRVYRLTGGTWTQLGGDIDGPAGMLLGAAFGQSVSISADGNRLIAAGQGGGKGSIGVFNYTGGAWVQQVIDFGTGGRMDGAAISADGHTVGIGEIYFRGTAGAASGIVRLYNVP